jgi:hypothetical protein
MCIVGGTHQKCSAFPTTEYVQFAAVSYKCAMLTVKIIPVVSSDGCFMIICEGLEVNSKNYSAFLIVCTLCNQLQKQIHTT